MLAFASCCLASKGETLDKALVARAEDDPIDVDPRNMDAIRVELPSWHDLVDLREQRRLSEGVRAQVVERVRWIYNPPAVAYIGASRRGPISSIALVRERPTNERVVRSGTRRFVLGTKMTVEHTCSDLV